MFGPFGFLHSRHDVIRVSVLTLTLCAAAATAEPASEPAADVQAGLPAEASAQAGASAYAQSCARCHGATGRGDGLDSKRFYPRPRNLALGVYKFRSTASGTPPTDADLFRTITQGLPGTNMPDWQHLSEETRWQLVSYLKSLSSVFAQTKPAPLTVASDPGSAHANLRQGQALYEKLGCAACHGSAGRANGTSAAGLVDDWGMPIRPADLTQGWSYRGGSDPRSVMLRVLSGIDGAGMPSYIEAMTPQEAWPLAYYVASLQEPAHWNMIAHPLRVPGALPTTLDDPRWAQAERTDVRLRNVVTGEGEWDSPPTVKAVSFGAIDNGEAIAFRFSWDDPSQDRSTPPDAFALLLKPSGAQGDVVTLQAWPSLGAPALDLCKWAANTGNVSETIAISFDSPAAAPTHSSVTTVASYADGQWRLLLQRPRHPSDPAGAATIAGDGYTSIAFAVWDGGNPKARAVSPWVEIALRADNVRRKPR